MCSGKACCLSFFPCREMLVLTAMEISGKSKCRGAGSCCSGDKALALVSRVYIALKIFQRSKHRENFFQNSLGKDRKWPFGNDSYFIRGVSGTIENFGSLPRKLPVVDSEKILHI